MGRYVPYCELHRHSDGSLYDGFGRAKVGVKYAAEVLKYPALALTDHGTMSSLVEHYLACKEYNIHPVLGMEGYFQIRYNQKDKKAYHITLLAKNMTGYQNLCRMMAIASEQSSKWNVRQYIPILTMALLSKYHEGIIMLSGCVGGVIPQQIIMGQRENAFTLAKAFQTIFGDDFYFEVMPFPVLEDGVDIQKKANTTILAFAKELDVRVVMTNDAHMSRPEEYDTYKLMYKLGKSEMKANYTNLHLHTGEQMADAWWDMMETDGRAYARESVLIAQKCQVELAFGDTVPQVSWGSELSSEELLLDKAIEGLQERGIWDWNGDVCTLFRETVYAKQLFKEYKVIKAVKFPNYFLMMADIVQFCRKNGIRCAARGSVCGSLLAYSLHITEVDPIVFGTYFSRFMREDKKVPPDIDLDIQSDRRDEVIAYVMQKYAGRACAISNFGYYKMKNLVNDMVKLTEYEKMSKEEADELKVILTVIGFEDDPDTYAELVAHPEYGEWFVAFEEKYPQFLLHFTRLFGQLKYIGKHAAGVVITKEAVTTYMPLLRVKNDRLVEGYQLQTGFDMRGLDKLGIMKFDLLGVTNQSVLAKMERATGKRMTYDILQNRRLFRRFADGDSKTTFQFGASAGICSLLQEVRPDNMNELAAVNAMYRPGPLSSGLIPRYIDGKYGKIGYALEEVLVGYEEHYAHDFAKIKWLLKHVGYGERVHSYQEAMEDAEYGEELAALDARYYKLLKRFTLAYADMHATDHVKSPWYAICADTYGLVVYQEQALRIGVELAHMDPLDVDNFIKGISKKNISEQLKEKFLRGLVEYAEMSEEEAETLFESVKLYSFNKNHCVGYSLNALYGQWLRTEDPQIYYSTILAHESMSDKQKKKRVEIEAAAILDNQFIVLPNINYSDVAYSIVEVDGTKVICQGLEVLKDVGAKAASLIVEERRANGPYTDEVDFLARIQKRTVNKRVVEALRKGGAMEGDLRKHMRKSRDYCINVKALGESDLEYRSRQNRKNVGEVA